MDVIPFPAWHASPPGLRQPTKAASRAALVVERAGFDDGMKPVRPSFCRTLVMTLATPPASARELLNPLKIANCTGPAAKGDFSARPRADLRIF
jgi:hypothetical protein